MPSFRTELTFFLTLTAVVFLVVWLFPKQLTALSEIVMQLVRINYLVIAAWGLFLLIAGLSIATVPLIALSKLYHYLT